MVWVKPKINIVFVPKSLGLKIQNYQEDNIKIDFMKIGSDSVD
jgi:hypothetical protein